MELNASFDSVPRVTKKGSRFHCKGKVRQNMFRCLRFNESPLTEVPVPTLAAQIELAHAYGNGGYVKS